MLAMEAAWLAGPAWEFRFGPGNSITTATVWGLQM
jgi:hypothetical protein